MQRILNYLLALLIITVGYFVYVSLSKPIKFNTDLKNRSEAVKAKLICIQTLQKQHESLTGNYSGDFKNMINLIKSSAIKDSLNLNACLDPNNVLLVPFSLDSFVVHTDTIDYQNRKRVVVVIKTKYKSFMADYLHSSFRKYNHQFDPDEELIIGDLISPSIKENWQ